MACVNRNGVICKIKHAFFLGNFLNYFDFFSHNFISIGIIINNLEFLYLPFPCSILCALL